MIGQPKRQLNILDSAFSNRKKKSRTDQLLREIDQMIDWPKLVKRVEGTYKPSRRGRPSVPVLYMLKILFLQYLYNLSDPAMEDALIDRMSFQRFVGLSFTEEVPDFTTIWRFRERLVSANLLAVLFEEVFEMVQARGKSLKRGKITVVDATLVNAARKKPKGDAQSSQQDRDARATKKGNKGYFGYKGHIGIDAETGMVHHARFTPANVHDSQEFDNLLHGSENGVFADKAYDSDQRKRAFRKQGLYYGILEKGRRNRSLSLPQQKKNKVRNRIRNRVERVFAHLKQWYGYVRVRYLTYGRNKLQFLFLCMVYNVRRRIFLMKG